MIANKRRFGGFLVEVVEIPLKVGKGRPSKKLLGLFNLLRLDLVFSL